MGRKRPDRTCSVLLKKRSSVPQIRYAKPQIRAGVLPGAAVSSQECAAAERQLGPTSALLAPLLEDDLVSLLVLVEAAAGRGLLPLLLAEHVLGVQPRLEDGSKDVGKWLCSLLVV